MAPSESRFLRSDKKEGEGGLIRKQKAITGQGSIRIFNRVTIVAKYKIYLSENVTEKNVKTVTLMVTEDVAKDVP